MFGKLTQSLSSKKVSSGASVRTGQFEERLDDDIALRLNAIAADKEISDEATTELVLIREAFIKRTNDMERELARARDLETRLLALELEKNETIDRLQRELESTSKEHAKVAGMPAVSSAVYPVERMVPMETFNKGEEKLLRVVLTVSPNSTDGRGKNAEEIRFRVMGWVERYVERHNIRVVSGPWLDDNITLTHPHVNLTVKGLRWGGGFDNWVRRKGYADVEEVYYEAGWEFYSKRNHKICSELRDRVITSKEAMARMRLVPGNNKGVNTFVKTPGYMATRSGTMPAKIVYDSD